jgi:hypothetical protein
MKHTITKSFLLFLLLAVAGTAKAQDYLPVVKDNAECQLGRPHHSKPSTWMDYPQALISFVLP